MERLKSLKKKKGKQKKKLDWRKGCLKKKRDSIAGGKRPTHQGKCNGKIRVRIRGRAEKVFHTWEKEKRKGKR